MLTADKQLVGEVLNVMRALAEEGRTMVVVTHEMDSAFRIADRMVMLDRGRVLRIGPRSEFEAVRVGQVRVGFEQPGAVRAQGVTRLDVLHYISHGISKLAGDAGGAVPSPAGAEPGAAEAGELPAARLASYHKLLAELRSLEVREDPLLQREERARWRSILKSVKIHRPRE